MPKQKQPRRYLGALPKQASRRDFNRYVKPYLSVPRKGPPATVSTYRIFNYVLYVLHTGMQWSSLRTRRHEVHWSNVYKWHRRWSRDGSYERLFGASVRHLRHTHQLDTSLLHGDGSHTVAKKGGLGSATPATSTSKVKNLLP